MFKTRNTLILGGLLAAAAVALAGSLSVGATKAADGPQVAHMVYFKLKDSSGANRAKLAAACKLLLHRTRRDGLLRDGHAGRRLERPDSTTAISTCRCIWFLSTRRPTTSTTNTPGT